MFNLLQKPYFVSARKDSDVVRRFWCLFAVLIRQPIAKVRCWPHDVSAVTRLIAMALMNAGSGVACLRSKLVGVTSFLRSCRPLTCTWKKAGHLRRRPGSHGCPSFPSQKPRRQRRKGCSLEQNGPETGSLVCAEETIDLAWACAALM